MNKREKIVFLGPVPPPYMGPSIATDIILRSKLNQELHLLHLDTSDRRSLINLGRLDFKNIYLAMNHYLNLIWFIFKHWPSLVYIPISQTTIGYMRDAVFILISKLFRRKVVCHLRGGNFKNWYNSASSITKWVVRRIHSLVDGQIVLGENLVTLFTYFVPRTKIFVVPNGISDIKKNFVSSKNNTNNIKVLFLSNFILEKGVLDVLYSIPEICHSFTGIEFIFAGNWRDRDTKRKFESFLEEHSNLPIIIKGPVYGKDKISLFLTSDVFVFPTYYPAEGHPWVIVEAMAAGLPIITTDQGAIIESVKDGINGFIVDKRNPRQISDKIKLLIQNPDLRLHMGKESRRLYLENFTEDKMIEKLSNTFKTVLAEKS